VHLRSEGPAARVAAGLALDRCRSTSWAVVVSALYPCRAAALPTAKTRGHDQVHARASRAYEVL
jgi:hypothetical protein